MLTNRAVVISGPWKAAVLQLFLVNTQITLTRHWWLC